MPTIKLVYFQARGRAEAIRLALAYGGIEFEDVRMPGESNWLFALVPTSRPRSRRAARPPEHHPRHPARRRAAGRHAVV